MREDVAQAVSNRLFQELTRVKGIFKSAAAEKGTGE